MFSEDYSKIEEMHGFVETVEKNAFWLEEYYFVRLKPDLLDVVSRLQSEMDPASYKAKWEKKMGEIVYLYKNAKDKFYFSRDIPRFYILIEKLSYYEEKHIDLRLVDKDSLTRNAARKMANYLYQGKGCINDIGNESAIAMMMYVRNGYYKKDFYNDLRKEMANGLEELVGGKEALETEELILQNPFPKENSDILDLYEVAKAHTGDYKNEEFILIDSEIAEKFRKGTKDRGSNYYDYEINDAMGHYAIVKHYWRNVYESREDILKSDGDLILFSMGTLVYYASDSLRGFLFWERQNMEHLLTFITAGAAVYEKNGLPAADFRKDYCRALIEVLRKENAN